MQSMPSKRNVQNVQNWFIWGGNLFFAVVTGIFLIPFFRSKPEIVHEFLFSLDDWQRNLFTFLACVFLTFTLFQIFSPKIAHLRYFWSHPAIWSAWLLGAIVLCLLDLWGGLSKGIYSASWQEWIVYAGGSLLAVSIVHTIFSMLWDGESISKLPEAEEPETSIEDLLKWHNLEQWLQADAPAQHDFLNNKVVANRLKKILLEKRDQSIGIIAPFGAGKTTVVQWTKQLEKKRERQFIFSEHNCWGFETSSDSIFSMLTDAITKVGKEIDTFQVRSLPESYRQEFSNGSSWINSVFKILYRKRNLTDQFKRISDLLGSMKVSLVFIVEDLDRNESRTFDVQEVLAFLMQLKEHPNISFVLTGGLKSPASFDFSKLCDHIEYLRTLSTNQAATVVNTLREQCLNNQDRFPHIHLNDSSSNSWKTDYSHLIALAPYGEVSPPEAISRLLITPRALRHAMEATYQAWEHLRGEIDFDHLLALNTLRCAAPEAFSYVLQHWHLLNDRSKAGYTGENVVLAKNVALAKEALKSEWANICDRVEWDTKAARCLIDLFLPATPTWLDDTGCSGSNLPQGLHEDRYWRRAVSGHIDEGEIRDQSVLRDIQKWRKNFSEDSALVSNLCSKDNYAEVWKDIAKCSINDKGQSLQLFSQVMRHIQKKHGAEAAIESQGLFVVGHYVRSLVGQEISNKQWLKKQITEAASTSLRLVNSLWNFFAIAEKSQPIFLQNNFRPDVLSHLNKELQKQITNGNELARLLSSSGPSGPFGLSHLVRILKGDNNATNAGNRKWLGDILLDGLRNKQAVVAINVCGLIAVSGEGLKSPTTVDLDQLSFFFRESESEVIDCIEDLLPQIDGEHRTFATEIIHSARVEFPRIDVSDRKE